MVGLTDVHSDSFRVERNPLESEMALFPDDFSFCLLQKQERNAVICVRPGSLPGKSCVLEVELINSLAIDPGTPQTVYAGTSNGGVFKSIDGGSNWSEVNIGLPDPYVFTLAVDPTTALTVYASPDSGGVYKSTDGGANWVTVNTGLIETYIYTLAIDPTTPQTIYAGSGSSGVYKSTDGGDNWTAITHLETVSDLNWTITPQSYY